MTIPRFRAALDRPMVVVGDEDGTALGTSTLGLIAVAAAPDLGGSRRAARSPLRLTQLSSYRTKTHGG